MSLSLRVHPEAAAELDAAIAWHDEGGFGRGEVFEAAYDRVVGRCLLWPASGSLYPLQDLDVVVRTAGVGRSLFRIVYFVDDENLWIVAVAHERRQPEYRTSRLEEALPG